MGSFAGANYDSASSLNKEIEMKEQELQKIKQEQSHAMARHQSEMQELKDGYEHKIKQLQEKNNLLKNRLEEGKCLNNKHDQKISTLKQQLKDFQLTSATSSFSKFTEEELKQLACMIHDNVYQRMFSLF